MALRVQKAPRKIGRGLWGLAGRGADGPLVAVARAAVADELRAVAGPPVACAGRDITRDCTPFLLTLQGMALQLQGIALPPF